MLLWELGFLHGNSKLWVYERLDFQIDSRILSQCFYGNFSFWIETWIGSLVFVVLDLLEIIATV